MDDERITIEHSNGHVTKVNISLIRSGKFSIKVKKNELLLDYIIETITPQLIQGTEVYITIKSKANMHVRNKNECKTFICK